MIDGSKKLNRQLAFELQNLRVFEKRSSAMTRVTSKRMAKKKTIGWQKVVDKTTTLHVVHHALLYISLPSLHDYDVKMPNFPLCGERERKTTTLYFFFS